MKLKGDRGDVLKVKRDCQLKFKYLDISGNPVEFIKRVRTPFLNTTDPKHQLHLSKKVSSDTALVPIRLTRDVAVTLDFDVVIPQEVRGKTIMLDLSELTSEDIEISIPINKLLVTEIPPDMKTALTDKIRAVDLTSIRINTIGFQEDGQEDQC